MAFGNKNSTPSFALTLPMKVTEQDEIFLSKKFRVGCTIYNQMVKKTTKMWHQLRKTREYKNLIKAIKVAPANRDERKALLVQRSNLIKQAGFSEGAFHKLVVPYQKAYNVNCDVAQKVASAVWKAWDDFFYGKGKTVHYKKLDDFVTLSGKKNNSGIFFRPANHTVSSMESAKRKAKNSIEKKYFDAYRKPDAKKDEEVVLPDEVKAQMDKDLPRKNCPSVLLNFLTEPLSKEICIPHSFYYILGRTFNPITRKPLKKISRSLRCCTTKQKNACKTATSGCLVALASKAPII